MMNYQESNASAWNRQSKRYLSEARFDNSILDFGDPRCLTDNDLNLVGDVLNKKILELGCGGAHISINLARRGGQVTAIDISEQQINLAKEEANRECVHINFEVFPIEDYVFKDDYDLVISICAFQYVDSLCRVFRRIYSNLIPGGEFIFSTNHPAFYTAAYSTIWKEEKRNTDYFDERPETWKWKDDDDFTFTSFPHPVEFYINQLSACGFRIDKKHELTIPHAEAVNEEEQLETIFPRYLVIKALKNELEINSG
jgi:SAM-dependent methyltransferase